jgi:hypothetical protein
MTAAGAGLLGATIVVALVLTRFASRVLLFLFKWWRGGYLRLVITHAVIGIPFSWGMAVAMAEDIGFGTALAIFSSAQLLWLAIDCRRYRRPAERKQPTQARQPKQPPVRREPHFDDRLVR